MSGADAREIMIRVKRTGVCATDLRIFSVGSSSVKPPVILGHEIAGEIVEIGSSVKNLKKGDKVCVAPDIYCGQCPSCISGAENLCDKISSLGYTLDGGYSEYLKLSSVFAEKNLVHHLPDDLPLEEGALTEPLACCLHGIKRAKVGSGQTILVVGDGPIGLMHVMLAKKMGSTVGVSGLLGRNLRLASDLGADFTINASSEDPYSKLNEYTEGGMANAVIVAVSSPSVIEQSVRVGRKNSVVLVFGGCPVGSRINLDPNTIHYGELTITGSSGYMYSEFNEALEIVKGRQLSLNKLITHHFRLDEIITAFNADLTGEAIKVMITQ